MLRNKLFYLFAAGALALASCNRDNPVQEEPDNTPDPNDPITGSYNRGDLPPVIPMSDTFDINNKAANAQLSYTYRGYAEPVTIGGQTLSATSIFAMNDVVFVTWHIPGATFGGSICAYKQSGIGRYTFTDRVDFLDADYYEVAASENSATLYYEVFMVGQRDQSSSNYVLNGHEGAVVTRIDYDYLNDEFWEPSVKELPLPGPSANGIVAAAAHYYVVTGDGSGGANSAEGGVYQVDRNLNFVEKADELNITDGIAITTDPTSESVVPGVSNSATIYTLDRDASTYRVKKATVSYDYTTDETSFTALSAHSEDGSALITPVNFERGDLTWAQGPNAASNADSLIIAVGEGGIFEAGLAGGNFKAAADFGPCLSTEFDASLGVLYYADPADGVRVLAMGQYANGTALNEYDLVGNFVPPTGSVFPNTFFIKEISLYRSRNIALATGDAGVYFLQRNKN